jgi:hypothetical protein
MYLIVIFVGIIGTIVNVLNRNTLAVIWSIGYTLLALQLYLLN